MSHSSTSHIALYTYSDTSHIALNTYTDTSHIALYTYSDTSHKPLYTDTDTSHINKKHINTSLQNVKTLFLLLFFGIWQLFFEIST